MFPSQEVISEVRVAKIDGQFKVNPNRSELAKADLEFMIAATEKNIMMVEGQAQNAAKKTL
jgi:polyribonucleotide nucleotidyltransferase